MLSPRPFVPSQYPLLHLIGILSIATTVEGGRTLEKGTTQDNPNVLVLPQELLLNALCFVTEQIHEVAEPYSRLHELLEDVSRLAAVCTGKNAGPKADELAKSAGPVSSVARRASTRASPSKRASVSPATTTRSLRRTASRNSMGGMTDKSITPPPSSMEPASDGAAAAKKLADKLKDNVESDIQCMKGERFDALMNSIAEFRVLLGELDNPNSNSFLDRTSPLGMWIRRAILNLNNMTYTELEQLINDIIIYASPATDTSTESSTVSPNLFATTFDVSAMQDTLRARAETFESYISSTIKNNYQSSLSSLLRFFDFETYPFAGGSANNRGLRQHALLSLAQFHFEHEEFQAARYACGEGMKIARQAGDLICLNALTSVLRRINFEDSSERLENTAAGGSTAPYDATREDPGGYVPPTDQLWDFRFGLSGRIPLPALACDLYRAKALHYASLTTKTNLSSKERRKEKKLLAAQGKDAAAAGADAQQKKLKWNRLDIPAWQATSADLWTRLGSDSVASTYRTIGGIMTGEKARNPTSIDADPTNGTRIVLLCAQAEELAQQGAYETAVALLLNEAVAESKASMTVRDVQAWQRGVYDVFKLQAKRVGYDSVLGHIETVQLSATSSSSFPSRHKPHSASESFTPVHMAGSSHESKEQSGLIGEIQSNLKRARKLLDTAQPALALPLAVKATSLSSLADGQGLLRLNQYAHLELARVQVAYSAPDRAIRVLDEVWPGMLGSNDIELTAKAKAVRAECLVACVKQAQAESRATEEQSEEILREAVELLQEASEAFESLGCPKERVEVLSKLAKLHHQMGDTVERDRVANHWRQASNLMANAGREESELLQRLVLVEEICARVSGRVAAT